MTRVVKYGPTLMAQPHCQRCQGTGFEPYLGRWRSDDPADWSECRDCGNEHRSNCHCFACVMCGINGGERR